MSQIRKTLALYPGSFDPITFGHIDIIERTLKVFDQILIVAGISGSKDPLFTVEERLEMIKKTCSRFGKRVRVMAYEGLMMDCAREHKAQVIVRGLRAVSDFEYEFQLANINKKLFPEIDTMFMMTDQKFFYISSRMVKEVAWFGGQINYFVTPEIQSALKKKMRQKRKLKLPKNPPFSNSFYVET